MFSLLMFESKCLHITSSSLSLTVDEGRDKCGIVVLLEKCGSMFCTNLVNCFGNFEVTMQENVDADEMYLFIDE